MVWVLSTLRTWAPYAASTATAAVRRFGRCCCRCRRRCHGRCRRRRCRRRCRIPSLGRSRAAAAAGWRGAVGWATVRVRGAQERGGAWRPGAQRVDRISTCAGLASVTLYPASSCASSGCRRHQELWRRLLLFAAEVRPQDVVDEKVGGAVQLGRGLRLVSRRREMLRRRRRGRGMRGEVRVVGQGRQAGRRGRRGGRGLRGHRHAVSIAAAAAAAAARAGAKAQAEAARGRRHRRRAEARVPLTFRFRLLFFHARPPRRHGRRSGPRPPRASLPTPLCQRPVGVRGGRRPAKPQRRHRASAGKKKPRRLAWIACYYRADRSRCLSLSLICRHPDMETLGYFFFSFCNQIQ